MNEAEISTPPTMLATDSERFGESEDMADT
jgi:hypothetical protein